VIILAVISIGQMLIPLAGNMLAPDDYCMQNANLKFYGYSTIYSYSWQQLLHGHFAYNIGEKLFALKKWMIVLPNILAMLVATSIFVVSDRRPPRNNLTQVRETAIK
jgi:hypothetical protein